MKTQWIVVFSLMALLLAGRSTTRAMTVSWDGGGGDYSWQNRTNWSADVLPGVLDDVVLNVGGGITITSSANVTIGSLQCSNHLALTAGTLRVSSGISVVQGQIFVAGNPVLSASGSSVIFDLPSATNVDGLGLEALSGARISFPILTNYNKGAGCLSVSWQAAGFGVLDLPDLTSLMGAGCAGLTLQALSGGGIRMTNLAVITEGALTVLADGAGSLVDFSALQQSPGTLRPLSFEVRNGGTIVMPQFPGGDNVSVVIKFDGSLPVTQLTELSGFTVIGTNVDFPSLTNLTAGNITVNSNAVVTATNLVSHLDSTECAGHNWLVTGAGSVLDFSHLTNLTGTTCGNFNLQATSGGRLILSHVTTIPEGILSFYADGTNSVMDLSGLQQCNATARPVTFEASQTGVILMPSFTGGGKVQISLASGGVLPVAQFTELQGFTVTGMNVNFPVLTNLANGDVTVNDGATVTAPSLASHNETNGCILNTWQVSGNGSVLDLSHLTSFTGAACGNQNLSATAGGLMILDHLATVKDGTVTFLADGTNSVLDLSALSQTTGSRTVTFSASAAGTILVPLFEGNTNAFVSLQSGGGFPASQMRRLLGFTVNGMSVEFSSLTNLTTGNVTASGGGTATAPNLTEHNEAMGCILNTWLATGAGSRLDFSALTNLVGGSCGALNIQAAAGGHVQLGSLGAINSGAVGFLADGAGSLLDLGALVQTLSPIYAVTFEARNNGTISFPEFQGGETVAVTIRSGGMLDTSELKLLKTLKVSGTSLNLPEITNLFAGDLIVDSGAVLSLPNIFNQNQKDGCVVNNWTVSGAGSVLDLSSLTNLAGSRCGSLSINALAGGVMNLSNLVTVSDGAVYFLADGINSEVDLDGLQASLAPSLIVSFEARNAGSISMPQMSGGPTVAVTIKTNGMIPTARFERLGNITILGTNATFTSLTNLDGGSFTVSNVATVIAPGLVTYAKGDGCGAASWIASGPGSVLDLPGLTELSGGTCTPLNIQAVNGGQILLSHLGEIPSRTVCIASSAAGSLINLGSLSNFLHASSLSTLTATNSGAIQLGAKPLIFSGVQVSFAAGTPEFPLTMFAATNLVLHGQPWQSYWVESRDTTSDLNSWTFFQRVPLTNDFQIIGPPAPANTEFSAREFVADPFALELTAVPAASQVNLVLFGPTNTTYEVQSATHLEPPILWQTLDTVFMTNTFRILAPVPLTDPKRFFRVNPL